MAQEFSIDKSADIPPKDAPYPTEVGTAITGHSASPPSTLASAHYMPAMAIITLESTISSK